MVRLFIATLLVAILICSFACAAHAEPPMLRLPLLPSVVTPLPPSVFTATTVPGASATMTAAALTPVDNSFIGRVSRFLDGLRPPVSGRPRDTVWRNPTLRDPARDRDATSFGIISAPMSASGAVFAGAGLGAGAAQFIDLAKVANKLPVKFTPTMCQGGGGIALKVRW